MGKKMTVQDAISRFRVDNAMLVGVAGGEATIERNNLAIRALERMTPTPPTHEATLYRCNTCPRCNNVIDRYEEFFPGQRIRVHEPACRYCGQLIDWSTNHEEG